ncbi:MAG: 2Fe-2S iron-sulfur cluster binding domain-containing protein, partial [Lentisphaerae bacterium]|nr:2Fe-2S iron-sulfur cluster binding domain-containing protein [Lentisphaerota bacterium]
MVFFVAVGTLCAICGALAFLLTLADRYLNDYGLCTISINAGERVFTTTGGDSLLTSLSQEQIFIPSACGGRGSCGLCKLKVLGGGGPLLPTETPHLEADEIKDRMRLSCQVKVREDMAIEIPEALFSVREFRACVTELTPLTHDIQLVRMELIDPETIDFTPGAYVQLQAPEYPDSPESVYRAYSVASDPRDTRHLDLIIRRVPGGICTTWVFDHLTVGQRVTFNGPHGDFEMSDTESEMIFIAGGSGMAPFLSMLLDMVQTQTTRPARYFFGAVNRRDMFYLDEMKEFEAKIPDFKFIPALSNPEEAEGWDGETGLVTDVVKAHYRDCSDKEAYLCGSPGMIDACVKVLTG